MNENKDLETMILKEVTELTDADLERKMDELVRGGLENAI